MIQVGTIASKSSKSLCIPATETHILIVSKGSGCIRRTPDSNSLVIENDSWGVVGIQLSEFSPLFHVELPSFLMNLDAVLPPRRLSSDSKFLLNRTASTSVPSPTSSPSMAAKFYSASETARVACLISSHLRSWRNSGTKVAVLCVDPVHRSSLRPLEVLRRGCFGECFLVMGGMAVSIGYLETTDWEEVVNEVDIFGSERDELSQCQVYEKLLSAASLILGSASSDVDILAAVGDNSTNMSVVVSGALLLDKLREEGTIVQ